MSIITLQVGQCGNQIGSSFLSTVAEDIHLPALNASRENDYENEALSRFFYETQKAHYLARAVMIDTELKVVQQIQTQLQSTNSNWNYCKESLYCHKRGSGNNWADGYKNHGTACSEIVETLVRRQLEHCDSFDGFLLCMSLAGGTGSGVGTKIAEWIREDLNKCPLLGCVVLPHAQGEISTQCYNSVLSLSHLLATSSGVDGLIMMENDLLQDACARRLGLAQVSMCHINSMIAHQLGCLLMPVENTRNSISGLLQHLCCHPDYKLLKLKCIPYVHRDNLQFGTETWPQLLKHLKQMMIADAHVEEGIDWSVKPTHKNGITLASALITRGRGCLKEVDDRPIREARLYSTLEESWRYCHWTQTRFFNQYERSAVLALNGQANVAHIEAVLQKAWQMFHSKAFIHQYASHHFTEENFMDCFATLEQLIHNYRFCL